MLKVVHVCWADDRGGAFIGARRLHEAFLKSPWFDSHLLVLHRYSANVPNVHLINRGRFVRRVYSSVSKLLRRISSSENNTTRSFNVIATGLHKQVNSMNPDVVQFHWVGNDTISLWEMKWIKAPIFWKLPDFWAFSGCAHYPPPGFETIYGNPSAVSKGLPYEHSWINLEWYMMLLKRQLFKNFYMTFVGPSRWIKERVKESWVFGHCNAVHILNPINTDVWRPLSYEKRAEVRQQYGFEESDFIILFASMNAMSDERKGFHYLKRILSIVSGKVDSTKRAIKCGVIGGSGPAFEIGSIVCKPLGTSYDENVLAEIYSTGDVFAFPSVMENAANTVKEATCCGLPCVAFDIGGNPDMVEQGVTGCLIQPYDVEEFALGLIGYYELESQLLSNARNKVSEIARSKHSQAVAAEKYRDLYSATLSQN